MRRRTVLLVLAALAAALGAGAALSASPSVTITTPKTNQKVSLHQAPYTAVAGTAGFAATTASTTRFYLRRDGCGTSSDNPHLSVTSGTDAGDGCGLVVDQVGPVGDAAPQATFTDYPASNGMPLAFDGAQPVNGQISLTGAQVGLAEVDVTLEALVGGNAVDLGSASGSAVLDPTAASTPVPFTIQPNTSLDGLDVQALDLRVNIHGPTCTAASSRSAARRGSTCRAMRPARTRTSWSRSTTRRSRTRLRRGSRAAPGASRSRLPVSGSTRSMPSRSRATPRPLRRA